MIGNTDLRLRIGDLDLPQIRRIFPQWVRIAESAGVLLAPAICAVVLRLRLMAPADMPDPAMHSAFIVDPHDVFTRYSSAYLLNAGFREGARVGFLVPARLAYLAFGAVPGFLVLRYIFALIAIGPGYLLLRRLYGPPAGVAGILIVLSSPVFVTAWGTDYPDSAVVSYAAGAISCLAMSCLARRRRAWLAAAGVLLTAAVWSHGVAVPLVVATLVAYVGVRLVRDRVGLVADLLLLASVALAVTGLLMAASAVLLGQANFIAITWQGVRYLSTPGLVAYAHSSNWRWALNVTYLLVPPAVMGAYAIIMTRRRRAAEHAVLQVGVIAAAQCLVYAGLQFFGTVETLEQHYFSSTLWAGVCLTLAIAIAELTRPLASRPVARWLPAAVLVAVPLCYEAGPHVPAFGWFPAGITLGVVVVAAAAAVRCGARLAGPVAAATATGTALLILTGAVLALTVAPVPPHAPIPGTASRDDPPPAYATALGGNSAPLIDAYRVATAMPGFVGPASYRGEQLLMWWPMSDVRFPNPEFAGMYHATFNTLPSKLPEFTARDARMIWLRRPGEILLWDDTAAPFPAALRALAPFRPALLRSATLRSGPVVLHLWLIRIGTYFGRPAGQPGSSLLAIQSPLAAHQSARQDRRPG